MNTELATTEESTETKEKARTLSSAYLCQWVTGAKEASSKHWKVSQDAWNEYLAYSAQLTSASEANSKTPSLDRYPIYWASINTLQPSYFARTPETVAKRMFDHEDPIARTACLLYERLSRYMMRVNCIEDAMTGGTLEFLISDKGIVRLLLETEEEQVTELIQVPVVITEAQEIVNAQTGEIIAEEVELLQGEDGQLYIEMEETSTKLVKVSAQPESVTYDDIIHTPNAKTFNQIKTIGFREWFSKVEFREKFGDVAYEKVAFVDKSKDKDDPTTNTSESGSTALGSITKGIEVWEVWDKPTKTVYYISENHNDLILKQLPDPYKLRGFFPCTAFVMATKPPKSMYPIPMYEQLRSVITQLHALFTRIRKLIKGLRRRAIADASLQEVIDAINSSSDLEVIASKNFQQLVEKKAVGDFIYYLPLQELSQALIETQNLLASFDTIFYQFSGVPDVVRGVTERGVGVETQQLKGEHFNVRSSWNAHKIQEMARSTIEMQCDLALIHMPDEMLFQICGVEYMAEENKQYAPQAFELLKNDEARTIRIEVETDSLTYAKDETKQEERNLVVQTIMQGLQQISDLAKTNPAYVVPAMKMLLMSLRGIDLGKDYEASVQTALAEVEKLVLNPPPPTEEPNFEAQKLELQGQKLQIESNKLALEQSAQALEGQRVQIEQLLAMLEKWKTEQEIILKGQQLQQSASENMAEISIKGQQVQVDAMNASESTSIDAMKAETDNITKILGAQVEEGYLDIEKQMAGVNAKNLMADNARLETQASTEVVKTINETKRTNLEADRLKLDAIEAIKPKDTPKK